MTKNEFEQGFKAIHSSLIIYIMKHGNVSRDDAHDIAQLAAFNSFKYLVIKNNQINCSLKTFIYTVARNELVDNIRRNKINSKYEINFSSFESDSNNFNIEEHLKSETFDECYDHAANGATQVELYKLLLSLKDKSKEYYDTLCLNVIHDVGYKECSSILNVPIGTIKSRIFKAKHFLKENLPETLKEMKTSK